MLNKAIESTARFSGDSNANVAVIFALALIPILTAVGCAVDYAVAVRIRAKLQSAADSASVAAMSVNSAGYTAAMARSSDGRVAAGEKEADNIFAGGASSISGHTGLAEQSVVAPKREAQRWLDRP